MIVGGKREPERRAVLRIYKYKFEMHRERVRENSKDRHRKDAVLH